MSPKFGISSPPTKLKSFKNDLAPVGFYFDIFPTGIFKIPIMPIPMRIDKISNGRATFFIIPDLFKLDSFLETLDLVFNFESFLIEGLKNLINYSKNKYKDITYRTLSLESLTNWFENSLNLKTEIPSLIEDFTFLLSEYLKMFAIIENEDITINSQEYTVRLSEYCDINIKFFKERIEGNKIQITEKGALKTVKLYREKKEKYYPDVISIDVGNIKKNKINKLTFVPYLIYDDILDCFAYNKKLLDNNEKKTIDLTFWKDMGIINIRSNINKTQKCFNLKNFNLNNLKLERLL